MLMGKKKKGIVYESLKSLALGILVVLLVLLLWGTLASRSKSTTTEDEEQEFKEFAEVVAEVYTKIKEKYVNEVDTRQLIKGAVEGMMMSLDGHSQFLDSDMLSQLEKDTGGEFSGIGIHIAIRDGILTVVAPMPGTPAAKAGLQPWDRIIEIEGKSTEGITLMEAVKKLTGPSGTKVSITVYREGEPEPLHFTLTRAVIKIPSVYYKKLEGDIGYIRLARFSENTSDDMYRALEDLKAQGIKALILDLRFNTGGLLTEAVKVADLLIPKGKLIVSTQGRLPSQNREYFAKEEPVISVPMVVLVNKGSASASEIVAGALKDHHLAIILAPKGQRTFGKGSVQTIEELEHPLGLDEHGNPLPCAIRLTTAHYYTPAGTNIEGKGIEPDVVVEVSKEQQIQLVKYGLLGEPRLIKPDEEEKDEESETPFYTKALKKDEEKEKEFVDVQLQFAVDLLKSLNILSLAENEVLLAVKGESGFSSPE